MFQSFLYMFHHFPRHGSLAAPALASSLYRCIPPAGRPPETAGDGESCTVDTGGKLSDLQMNRRSEVGKPWETNSANICTFTIIYDSSFNDSKTEQRPTAKDYI